MRPSHLSDRPAHHRRRRLRPGRRRPGPGTGRRGRHHPGEDLPHRRQRLAGRGDAGSGRPHRPGTGHDGVARPDLRRADAGRQMDFRRRGSSALSSTPIRRWSAGSSARGMYVRRQRVRRGRAQVLHPVLQGAPRGLQGVTTPPGAPASWAATSAICWRRSAAGWASASAPRRGSRRSSWTRAARRCGAWSQPGPTESS